MTTGHANDVDTALAVVAAKAWAVLATGDVADAAVWDDALAWVRLGRRIAGERDADLVDRVQHALPPVPLAFP